MGDTDKLDYMVDSIDYRTAQDGRQKYLEIWFSSRNQESRSVTLAQEDYNSKIIETEIAKTVTPSFLKWDGTEGGLEELSQRLVGKFLSKEEFVKLGGIPRKERKKHAPKPYW